MASSNGNVFRVTGPVNSLHKGQWRGALMFHLNSAWINGWVYNPEAGDLRRHRTHYDVTVMIIIIVELRRCLESLLGGYTILCNNPTTFCEVDGA